MQVDLSKYNQDWYDRGKPGWFIILWWVIQGTIFRFSLHNMYKFRIFILRLFGAKIGRNVKIRASAKFHYPWKVEIGDNSWIGDNVYFYSLDRILIGSNCVISQNTYINTGSHDIASPFFDLITKSVVVENSAWITSNCFVNLGTIIGEHSIITPMSCVNKDVPKYSIVGGNPAKYIRKREMNKL